MMRRGACAWGREGSPVGLSLEPSPVSRGEDRTTCAKQLGRGRKAGRQPWGGEGTPGSAEVAVLNIQWRWLFLVWCCGAAKGSGPCV